MVLAASCDALESDPAGGYAVSSESCGACHAAEYDAWIASPHGQSSASPVFRALVVAVRDRWGEAAARRCEGCHAPGHDGSLRIGCVTCHAATGNRGTRDGLLVVDLGAPLAGPGTLGARPPHAMRSGGFLAASELCGTCHEVTGPEHFIEPTFTEFQASAAAAAGLSCVSCHLPRDTDGAVDHRLASVTPSWAAPPAVAAARRSDTLALLRDALRLEIVRDAPGGGRLRVRLTNVGAAHAVPTGATLVRELWVEVRGTGGAVARPIVLGATLSRDGLPVALPTDADTVAVQALAAGEAIERLITVEAPFEATLFARPVRADAVRALGFDLEDPALAPFEVARVQVE